MNYRTEAGKQAKSFLIKFGIVVGIAGYVVLAFVDWRVALGVFIVHWSINLFSESDKM